MHSQYALASQPLSLSWKISTDSRTKSFLQITQNAYTLIKKSPTSVTSNTLNVNWHISKKFPADLNAFFHNQLMLVVWYPAIEV